MESIHVRSNSRNQLIEITDSVSSIVSKSEVVNGLCVVYTPHTTAAITINENADPDVMTDMLLGLDSLSFQKLPFRHAEGNSDSHLKSSIIGCSETIIIQNGKLLLGTWQGLYFCEFDGPRNRSVFVTVSKA